MIGHRENKSGKHPLLLTLGDHLFKNGDLLGLWDAALNIDTENISFHGLYWKGMRYLSTWKMEIGQTGIYPLDSIQSSEINRGISPYYDHVRLLGPYLKNLFLADNKQNVDFDGPLLIDRARFCGSSWMIEEVSVYNHAPFDLKIPLRLQVKTDFHDMMDVRGIRTDTAPAYLESLFNPKNNELIIRYNGTDYIERKTIVHIDGLSMDWYDSCLNTTLTIPPLQYQSFRMTVKCAESRKPTSLSSPALSDRIKKLKISSSLKKDQAARNIFREEWPLIDGEGLPLKKWTDNAIDDIRVLLSRTKQGYFPYAGIPWFSTPFGRDALITGFSTLWAFPALSKSILLFLAAKQAKKKDLFHDAEPGKILHEFRYGEAGKDPSVPFGVYYGSVDSTPLFVALCWSYYSRTLDKDLLLKLKPVLIRAMNWIEKYGVHPDTGFLVYFKDPKKGLIQKGWKDSQDSVFHSDGSLAEHPIALSEVQGYLYMAYHGFSKIMDIYKEPSLSKHFEKKAIILKARFNREFWSDKINMFSLAIDGNKRPCEVRASNAGHLLISGIADSNYAKQTALELLKSDLYSGWGIRTLSAKESRFNPVSYHNGSVWPHDNAIIMAGFAKYGLRKELSSLAGSYFSTLPKLPSERPPELYCGFTKEESDSPLSYPTSCRIQSWSVASIFLVIQSIANLGFDAKPTEYFEKSSLPYSLNKLTINNISSQHTQGSHGRIEIDRSLCSSFNV
jgi:glycogen debranching enzyme